MKDLKSKIIPNNLKFNIDEILEQQLFNANRYYAESNPVIFSLMEKEKDKDCVQFLDNLQKTWDWHNYFYEELLEPSYLELINSECIELTPIQIKELIEVYKTCSLVDHVTLVPSGSIKKFLMHHYPNISIDCEEINKSYASFMLLTPPVDSFFVKYYIDHLSYIILLKTNLDKANTYKKYLLNEYHANDEIIFQSRFKKKFENKMNSNVEDLAKEIEECKISDEYKLKHFYFTLEHPERKAFRDIIIYDNVIEKLISCRLIGISGFLFRKQILKYLNESKKLENQGYIYEFNDDVIINSLKELYNERKNEMEKDIKLFKQHGDTCAIACMLMILEYYKIIPKANKLYEKRYYRLYKSNILDGTPFSALAWHFAKNGLDVELIHSEENMFSNKNNFLEENLYNLSKEEYNNFLNRAISKGVLVKNGINIDCNLLKQELEENKIIVLAGEIDSMLHAIILCGYKDNSFIVCDPLFSQKQIKTFNEIEEFMNTNIGKWFLAVSQKQINKEKLLENVPKFIDDSEKILNKKENKIKKK